MAFDPKPHLIQLPRRVKDPQTSPWATRLEDYLEVKWRLVWFCECYPYSVITTEEVCVDLAQDDGDRWCHGWRPCRPNGPAV